MRDEPESHMLEKLPCICLSFVSMSLLDDCAPRTEWKPIYFPFFMCLPIEIMHLHTHTHKYSHGTFSHRDVTLNISFFGTEHIQSNSKSLQVSNQLIEISYIEHCLLMMHVVRCSLCRLLFLFTTFYIGHILIWRRKCDFYFIHSWNDFCGWFEIEVAIIWCVEFIYKKSRRAKNAHCSYMTYECCDDEFNVRCALIPLVVLPRDTIFWIRKLRGSNRISIDFTREPIVYTDVLYGLWYLPTTTLNRPHIVSYTVFGFRLRRNVVRVFCKSMTCDFWVRGLCDCRRIGNELKSIPKSISQMDIH